MAGSVVKPPRRVGSPKLLIRTAQTQGNTGGGSGMSSQSTSGGTAPVPNSAPPGMINPQNPQTSNAWLAWSNSNNQNNFINEQNRDRVRGEIRAEQSVRSPQQIGSAFYTPDPPQYGTGAPPAVQKPLPERPAVGGGMVRGRDAAPSRADRMGVSVVSGGSAPIRIDNNDAIKGQATAEQAQQVRTTNPNSVFYQETAPGAAATDAAGNIVQPAVPVEISTSGQNNPALQGNVTSLSDPLQSNRVNPQLTGTLPAPSGGGTSTSSNGLSPAGTSQQALTSSDNSSTATANASNENLPNPGGIWGPIWDKLSTQQKQNVLGVKDYLDNPNKAYDEKLANEPKDPVTGLPISRHNAVTKPGADESGDPRYNEQLSPRRYKNEEGGLVLLQTPNEVADVYNIPPDQARYYMEQGYSFADTSGGGKPWMVTPEGRDYTGSEVNDALSKNPTDPSNAMEGRATYTSWADSIAEEKGRVGVESSAKATEETTQRVEEELNKPLDLTALTAGYDKAIADQRKAAARNKALALQAIQEQGALSGSSVNQMMGLSTEAGYGYDTTNQAQESMMGLQKEMAKVQATKEDANRKLQWSLMLYNNAKTDEGRAKAWAQHLENAEIMKQQGIYEANLQSQMNSPSLAMTLAKVGIGVGGAVLAPFTGGTSLLVAGALGAGLQGAESAGVFGGGADAYSAYNQAQRTPAPGSPSSFTYQGPPGANNNPLSPGQLAPITLTGY